MPVAPGQGIDASLPNGALRLDVNPSEANTAVTIATDGVKVQPQYGAEAMMRGVNLDGFPWALLVNGFNSGFGAVASWQQVLDYSELSSLPQVDAASGVLTARTEGIYEVGVQLSFAPQPVLAAMHTEVAIWTDYGFNNLPLNPASPNTFGTANTAYGSGWQRIGVSTQGYSAAAIAGASTVPDLTAFQVKHSTLWCVRAPTVLGVGNQYPYSSAAPTRFRFSFRVEAAIVGDVYVQGTQAASSLAWMRWLGGVT